MIPLNEGKLEGLPAKYQPATFSKKDRKLEIGELSVVIPDCIWKRVEKMKKPDFRFSASWYHEPEILPPYIAMDVSESGTQKGFYLLLNLDTLGIIFFQEKVQTSESSWMLQKIPLGKTCTSNWHVQKKNKIELKAHPLIRSDSPQKD